MTRDWKPLGRSLVLAAAIVSGATAASALPVQWTFTGTVTLVDGGTDELAVLDGLGVDTGASVTGTVAFESTAPDLEPDSQQGIYESLYLTYAIQVGGYEIALGGGSQAFVVSLGTLDPNPLDAIPDSFELSADGNDTPDATPTIPPNDPSLLGMNLLFLGPLDALVLSSDVLPLLPPDLSVFTGTGQVLEPQGRVTIEFSIDSIELVPEPGVGVLVGLASLALGIGARPRRSP